MQNHFFHEDTGSLWENGSLLALMVGCACLQALFIWSLLG